MAFDDSDDYDRHFYTDQLSKVSNDASMSDSSLRFFQTWMNDAFNWIGSFGYSWENIALYGGIGLLVISMTIGFVIGSVFVLKILWRWWRARASKKNHPMAKAIGVAGGVTTAATAAAALRQKALGAAASNNNNNNNSNMGTKNSTTLMSIVVRNKFLASAVQWIRKVLHYIWQLIVACFMPLVNLWRRFKCRNDEAALEKFRALSKSHPTTPEEKAVVKAELQAVAPAAMRCLANHGRMGEVAKDKRILANMGIVV